MTRPHPTLFASLAFARGITLRNRIVMAPMTTWSANPDGTVSDEEVAWYRQRVGGVGLVITGCSHVRPNGIGFTGEFSSSDDRFVPSLRRLAEAAKSGGAPALLQLYHAGNKALPHVDVFSASAVPTDASAFAPALTPRALTTDEIADVVRAFGEATQRAIDAGFDGVELHGAHGFLLQNFLSPRFNQRTDAWGGTPENRMRFPLAVVHEVRRVIEAHANRPFLLGYRVSPEESGAGGLRVSDVEALLDRLVDAVDYVHVSLASALDQGDTISRILDRIGGRVPVVAAGSVRTPDHAQAALARGLSLVAVAQGLVMNPRWVEQAQAGASIDLTLCPSRVAELAIPSGLWAVIQGTPGWFALAPETSTETTLSQESAS